MAQGEAEKCTSGARRMTKHNASQPGELFLKESTRHIRQEEGGGREEEGQRSQPSEEEKQW